jgi:hypothetical protein
MRLKIFVLCTLSVLSAASAQAHVASSCDVKYGNADEYGTRSADATPKNKAQFALEKTIDERFKNDGSIPSLYFVLPGKDPKNPEIVALKIPTGDGVDRLDIPKDLVARLAKSGPIKVFNRTDGAGIGKSRYSSFYFVPFTTPGLKGMNPKFGFDNATNTRANCSIVDFKGHETLSVLYNNISQHADDVTNLHAKQDTGEKLSDYQHTVLAEAISILDKKLGYDPRRAPASLEAPVYEESPKVVQKRGSKKLGTEPVVVREKKKPAVNSGNGD